MVMSIGTLPTLCSLLLSFALFHQALVSAYDFSTGTCKSLSGSRLTNPCVGVVDYSYFLPSGSTEAALAKTASIKLNSTVISSTPMACQTSLVRYVCASIFLKCKVGVTLSDSSTYNTDIYSSVSVSYGVPYLRPCGTVCTDVNTQCTGTGRMLTLPGTTCATATYDYSLGSVTSATPLQYQTDNDATKCFSPLSVSLSGAKETYDTSLSNAICSGFVNEFYVPPANKINPAYTSLQLPKVVQTMLNTAVTTSFNQLKSWMSAQCMNAFLERVCYSTFLPVQDVTLQTALQDGGVSALIIAGLTANSFPMASTVSIPSYPHYSYCTNYLTKCASLITSIPATAVNCNATTTGTDGTVYKNFPAAKQTISSVSSQSLTFNFMSNAATGIYYNETAYTIHHTSSASSTYAFSAGTCKTLTGASRLTNPCVGVVTYSYYLPSGTTDAALAKEASTKLNSSVISSMPLDCQMKLVRYTCATIYLKCKDSVALSDESTYNYNMYASMGVTYGVPYLRPCGSVCTDLFPACTLTGRLVTLPTPTQCNTERYDYSKGSGVSPAYPARFQTDNDVSVCYTPHLIPLSGAKETYDSTAPNAVCAGFVDKFFVPPANKINTAFTSLQPPKVVQTLINTGLAASLSQLKPWIGEECMLALKKRYCYSYFLTPEDVTIRTALEQGGTHPLLIAAAAAAGLPMTATVTIPSYPHYNYCTDFKQKCALLIEQAPVLDVDCNATTTNSDGTVYRVFPSNDQTISTASKVVGANTLNMKFRSNATSNNYYNSTYNTYTTVCPRGFSVPADPDAKEVQIIGSSNCAADCLMPIWTPDEWKQITNISEKAPILGVIASVLLIVFLIFTKELVNSHMILMYAIISLVVAAQSTHFQSSSESFEERVCYDKTRYISQEQGPSECVDQGATIVYTFLASVATLCLLSIEWTLRTSGYQWVTRAWWYFVIEFVVVFVLPIIPTAYAGSVEAYGFSKAQGWCYIRSVPYAPENLDVGLTALPLLIGTLISFFVIVVTSVVHHIMRCTRNHKVAVTDSEIEMQTPAAQHVEKGESGEGGESKSSWFTPADGTGETAVLAWIMVLVFSIVLLFPFLARFGLQYSMRDEYYNAFVEWVQCVFTNFDGTDSSWEAACGTHASQRPALGMVHMNTLVLTSHSIFVLPVFVLSYLFSYYYRGTHRKTPHATRVVQVGSEAKAHDQHHHVAEPQAAGSDGQAIVAVAQTDDNYKENV